MKKDLLNLINDIDNIESKFYVHNNRKFIYDIGEFIKWKQNLIYELNSICESVNDTFICNTLTLLQDKFEGYKDEKEFYELSGSLIAIKNNINKYYPEEEKTISNKNKKLTSKNSKIFISHASQDKNYVIKLVELLENIGIQQEHLICSSIPEYGIPLSNDIYDYLKKQFQEHDLHIIFVLSDNYYNSPACLNEMGAAWMLQNKYTIILLPEFEFKEIKGAINPRQIGLKLYGNSTDVKERLGELKNNLIQEFKLPQMSEARWERKRDDFINKINTQILMECF